MNACRSAPSGVPQPPTTATLDQAVAAVVTATGDKAAVAVTGLVPVTTCQKTFLAKGHTANHPASTANAVS
jgi:hypothetical protein